MKECKLLCCEHAFGRKRISAQKTPVYSEEPFAEFGAIEWFHYPAVEEELSKYLNDGWTIVHTELQEDRKEFLLIRDKE